MWPIVMTHTQPELVLRPQYITDPVSINSNIYDVIMKTMTIVYTHRGT